MSMPMQPMPMPMQQHIIRKTYFLNKIATKLNNCRNKKLSHNPFFEEP